MQVIEALQNARFFLSKQWVGSLDVDRLYDTLHTLKEMESSLYAAAASHAAASHSKSHANRTECTCNGRVQASVDCRNEGKC